jgi:P27 family predicted phage terminase small subunit
VWKQIVPVLDGLGVLTKIDGNALARYCRLFVRWRQCDAFIREHGESYETTDQNGRVTSYQQYPEVGIVNKLSVLLLRLEQEFGLTPSARARIEVDVEPPRGADDKERFFKVVG